MKTFTVKIGNKEFNLAYTVEALELLEDLRPDFSIDKIAATLQSAKGFQDVLYCLAVAGAHLEGREIKEDRRWFSVHSSPNRGWYASMHEIVCNAIADGMNMETDEEDPDREVDVVLEELKKKDGKAD